MNFAAANADGVLRQAGRVRASRIYEDFDGSRVKRLREDLGMTQENFAYEVGVTLGTVNRWENGHTKPNQMAQRVLLMVERKFCKMKKHI